MKEKSYGIGQLSKLTDCKIPTIRWYEERGLLPVASRNAGNQRRYNQQHLTLLRFIRHARQLGFDLPAIEQLQKLCSCCLDDHLQADQIAKQHLADVQQKIAQLQAMETELNRMIDNCSYEDEHQCQVLEVLANHKLCSSGHVV
ncbi:MAG: helix-turn-helix domain-containing protein [Amphritea sp.]|nr:helix-turn-helix domain-containing protein [Amphritea sp.]MBQ0784444.1 helix-turn-helix domain-containing protein [Amphritea sp.]